MAYTFDGDNKLVILDRADISVQDIYSRWIDWLAIGDNSKYLFAMRSVGGDPISATRNLGLTFFMTNGWRIRPMEADHRLTVAGNLYTDPSGFSPFVPTVGNYNVMIEMSVSSLVDSTLAQMSEIQQSMFQESVTISTTGTAGTAYPVGTPQYPVNNLTDAKLIAAERGFNTLRVVGTLTVGATESISNFTLAGQGVENSFVVLTSGCITSKTTFKDLTISGRQNGETHYRNCEIGDLSNIHCEFIECRLIGPLAFHANAADTSVFFQCYTADVAGATTIFDMNNSPCHISMNQFSGKLQINNLNKATAGVVTINMAAGKVILDSTCTTGQIKIRGNGEVVDNSLGSVVDNDVTANLVSVSASALTPQQAAMIEEARMAALMALAEARLARQLASNRVVISSDDKLVSIYADDGSTILHQFDVSDDKRTRTPASPAAPTPDQVVIDELNAIIWED